MVMSERRMVPGDLWHRGATPIESMERPMAIQNAEEFADMLLKWDGISGRRRQFIHETAARDAAIRAEEREACAQVALHYRLGMTNAIEGIAAEIRKAVK